MYMLCTVLPIQPNYANKTLLQACICSYMCGGADVSGLMQAVFAVVGICQITLASRGHLYVTATVCSAVGTDAICL